jgi:DNA-binding XRE family transcriptional regulator
MGRRPKADEVPVFSRLEEWRTHRGLTRQELADVVSVHYQTIGYLERGEYSPSLVLALQIASALDVPLEEIFSLEPFDRITTGR